jgi:tRNA (guanine-N7-)-methyltransferase
MAERLPGLRAPQGPFNPREIAPGAREVWLEIGFGGGEHMAAQAARAPDLLIMGAEPFVNGVASAVRHIDEQGLTNIRLHDGDARDLIARLPDGAVDRVFILFPDPWPKARHHKRRLIQPDTVAALARVMRSGARLRFASDWADYVSDALATLRADPAFRWIAARAGDWRMPPPDHITTRYEEKRLGDCAPVFLDFVRT